MPKLFRIVFAILLALGPDIAWGRLLCADFQVTGKGELFQTQTLCSLAAQFPNQDLNRDATLEVNKARRAFVGTAAATLGVSAAWVYVSHFLKIGTPLAGTAEVGQLATTTTPAESLVSRAVKPARLQAVGEVPVEAPGLETPTVADSPLASLEPPSQNSPDSPVTLSEIVKPLDPKRSILDQLQERGARIERVIPSETMPQKYGVNKGYNTLVDAQAAFKKTIKVYESANGAVTPAGRFDAQAVGNQFGRELRGSAEFISGGLTINFQEALLSQNPGQQLAAINLLRDIAIPELTLNGVELLLQTETMNRLESAQARWSAIEAVATLHQFYPGVKLSRSLVDHIEDRVKRDAQLTVRQNAAFVLGTIGRYHGEYEKRMADRLILAAIHDEAPEVRRAAREALKNSLGYSEISHPLLGNRTLDLDVEKDVGPSLRPFIPLSDLLVLPMVWKFKGEKGERTKRIFKTMPRRSFFVLSAIAAAVVSACGGGDSGNPPTTTPNQPPAPPFDVDRAGNWLGTRIHPIGLIESFQGLSQTNPSDPSVGVTWTFNQAQTIEAELALGMVSGNFDKVRQLCDGLLKVRRPDGSWQGAYLAATGEGVNLIVEQGARWVGPNVAAGAALLSAASVLNEPRYFAAAQLLSGWLDPLFKNSSDSSYGFLRGGPDVFWASTEHNLRAMAFYAKLGTPAALQRVNKIAAWVNTKMFAGDHYHVGITDVNTEALNLDIDFATDVQVLGQVMASRAGLNTADFNKGMNWLLARRTFPTYNGRSIAGVPRALSAGGVWGEGTATLIAALYALGRGSETASYLATLDHMQAADGSLPAAVGGTPGWPGTFAYGSPEAVAPAIAAVKRQPERIASREFPPVISRAGLFSLVLPFLRNSSPTSIKGRMATAA